MWRSQCQLGSCAELRRVFSTSSYLFADTKHPAILRETKSIPLKVNPQNVQTFSDLKIPPRMINSLSSLGIYNPLETQKKIIALLYSGVSISINALKGSGTSTAIAAFTALKRPMKMQSDDTASMISSLILVPSPQLARQYVDLIGKITQNQVQAAAVFRGDEACTACQEKALASGTPEILISTPTRLLDLLADPEKRHLVPVHALNCIAIDEADWQFKDSKSRILSNSSTRSKVIKTPEAPIDTLLNYVVGWRDSFVRHNAKNTFSPLQLVVASSKKQYQTELAKKPWMQKNKRPLIKIGASEKSLGGCATAVSKATLVTCSAHNWVERLGMTIKENGSGIVVVPEGAPLAALNEELKKAGIHTIMADQSVCGYSEHFDPSLAFSETNNTCPTVLQAKPLNLQGINFPGLQNLYLVSWKTLEETPRLIDMLSISEGRHKQVYMLDETNTPQGSIPPKFAHMNWHCI